MSPTPLRDALFTRTQQRVLSLFFGKPDTRLYTNEILRTLAMGRGTVTRELDRLCAAGILLKQQEGNLVYYQANSACAVFHQLKALILVLQEQAGDPRTAAPASSNFTYPTGRAGAAPPRINEPAATTPIDALAHRYHISRLGLFGSAARGEMSDDSDIDLLVEFAAGHSPSLGELMRLNSELSACFGGRKVDLATTAILRNPYRRRTIEKDLQVLYDAH